MATPYVALIGDAIASRALPDRLRAKLQAELRRAMPDFNRRWRRFVVARFAVTLGDEFQCLLSGAEPVWDIAHAVRSEFPEVDWVVACGRGPITTHLGKGLSAPEVDGPCFHLARAAMEAAKRRRLLLAFGGFPSLVGAFTDYYSALYWSWTPRQRRAATLLRCSGSPAGVAAALRIHPSAVSHLKRRMAWPLVDAGDKMFRAALLEAK
jgi:SatD family protein